jgi:predicted nucleic acid-binding protein
MWWWPPHAATTPTTSKQGASFKLLPMVVASYLRLITHPKIFAQPTPIAEAIAFIDAVLSAAGVNMPNQSAEWPKLRRLCLENKLSANALPDAWLAAAVLQMDDHLVTFDAGFKHLLPARALTVLNGKA